jgi:hypothetical protein
VFKASTGTEVASLAIGNGADATFFDPRRKVVLIPCGEEGVLEIISLADPKHISVIQHVATQKGSRTGAVDPRTGRVYMMAFKFDPVRRSPTGRPIAVPGSYAVLVVGPEG